MITNIKEKDEHKTSQVLEPGPMEVIRKLTELSYGNGPTNHHRQRAEPCKQAWTREIKVLVWYGALPLKVAPSRLPRGARAGTVAHGVEYLREPQSMRLWPVAMALDAGIAPLTLCRARVLGGPECGHPHTAPARGS